MTIKPFDFTTGISWTKATEPFSAKMSYCHNVQWETNAISSRGGSLKLIDFSKEPYDDINYAGYINVSDVWEYKGEIYIGTTIPKNNSLLVNRDDSDYNPYYNNTAIFKVVRVAAANGTGYKLQRVFWHAFYSGGVANYWDFNFKRFTPDTIKFWRGIETPKGRLIFTGGRDFFLQTPDGAINKYISEAPPIDGQVSIFQDVTKLGLGSEWTYPTDGVPADQWVDNAYPTVRSQPMHFLPLQNSGKANYLKRHIWKRDKYHRQDWSMPTDDDTDGKHGYYDEHGADNKHVRVERATLKRVLHEYDYDGLDVGDLVSIDADNGYYEINKPDKTFITQYKVTIENKISESAASKAFGANEYVTTSKSRAFFDPRVKHHFKREKGQSAVGSVYWNLDDKLSNLKTYPLAYSRPIIHAAPNDTPTEQKDEIVNTSGGSTQIKVYAPYGFESFTIGKTYEVWRPKKVPLLGEGYVGANMYCYSKVHDTVAFNNTSFELTNKEDLGNGFVILYFDKEFEDLTSDKTQWCINDYGDISAFVDSLLDVTRYYNSKEEHFFKTENDQPVEPETDNIPRIGFLECPYRSAADSTLELFKNPGYMGAIAGRFLYHDPAATQDNYFLTFPRSIADIPIQDEGNLVRYDFYQSEYLMVHGPLIVFEATEFAVETPGPEYSTTTNVYGYNRVTETWDMLDGVTNYKTILSDFSVASEDVIEQYVGEENPHYIQAVTAKNVAEIPLSMVRRFTFDELNEVDEDNVFIYDEIVCLDPNTKKQLEYWRWLIANAEIDDTDSTAPLAKFKVNFYRRVGSGDFQLLDTQDIEWDLSTWTSDNVFPDVADLPIIQVFDKGQELSTSRILRKEEIIMPTFEGAIYWDDRLVAWHGKTIWWTKRGDYTSFSPLRTVDVYNDEDINQISVVGAIEYVTGKNANVVILQKNSVWLFTLDNNDLPILHMMSKNLGGRNGVLHHEDFFFVGEHGMFVMSANQTRAITPVEKWVDMPNWEKYLSKNVNWDASRIFALHDRLILSMNINNVPIIGDEILDTAPENYYGKLPTDDEGRFDYLQSHYKGCDNRSLELIFDLHLETCNTRQWHLDYRCHNESIPEGYTTLQLEKTFQILAGGDTFALDDNSNLLVAINTFDEFSWCINSTPYADYRNNGCLLLHTKDLPPKDCMLTRTLESRFVYGSPDITTGNWIDAYIESQRMPVDAIFTDPAAGLKQLYILSENNPSKLSYIVSGLRDVDDFGRPLVAQLVNASIEPDGYPMVMPWDKLRTLMSGSDAYDLGKWQLLGGVQKFDRVRLGGGLSSPFYKIRLNWRITDTDIDTGLKVTTTSHKWLYLVALEVK
jgi:hypothetical protein